MIRFDEVNHSYYNEFNEKYTSVTAFIKQFVKPFEKEKIAAKYAKKHKRSIEDVLAEWDNASKEAILKGLAYHKLKEDEVLSKEEIELDNESHKIVRPIWEDNFKVNEKLVLEPGIYPELIVWSDRYRLAGQADYVEMTKTGFINVRDYKTSKEIKKESFKSWDGVSQKMLRPLAHFEDCNFNHYALQINLYAFLIKQQNRDFKIGKLFIEHVQGDFENNVFKINNIVEYQVPNLQADIKNLLILTQENRFN